MPEGNDFKVRSFHSLSSQSLGSVASQPVCSEAEYHDNEDHGVDYSVSAQGREYYKRPRVPSIIYFLLSHTPPPKSPFNYDLNNGRFHSLGQP